MTGHRRSRCFATFGRFSISLSLVLPPSVGASCSLSDVYGPGVAICARPPLEVATSTSRDRRDTLSARPIAVAADAPTICSAGGTDPELLAQLRDGGLPVGTDLREFRGEAEFAVRVAEALDDGLLIAMEYPQPLALCPDERALKTARLVGFLNNKASISTFVDQSFQAHRVVVPRADLADMTPVQKSWVLKAATDDPHGGNLDVYLHQADEPVALPAFTHLLSEFVIEEYLDIVRNWGLQLSIGTDGTARLLAVTEQRVDADGIYLGGRFGLVNAPPADLLAECLAVAQRAGDLGYRGLCSLDCAQTRNGRLVMLDLNFRITSGSIPLLALRSVRPDALDRPAESLKLATSAPLADLLAELRPALATGGLLAIGGHDSTRTDNPIQRSTLQLLVYGDDPADVAARRSALEARINH